MHQHFLINILRVTLGTTTANSVGFIGNFHKSFQKYRNIDYLKDLRLERLI